MKERWIEMDPCAEEKQDERLTKWADSGGIQFETQEAKVKYQERCEIIQDAFQMKKTPRRVPVSPSAGYFPLKYAGVTWKEAMYDYEKLNFAYEKYNSDFDPDTGGSSGFIPPGRMFDILDYKPYLWAGRGIGENDEYQYVENEYMRADEYQDLIDDPTGWFINEYIPRNFGNLEGFTLFPMPAIANEFPMVPSLTIPFGIPPLVDATNKLLEAATETHKWLATIMDFSTSSKAKGYSYMGGTLVKAPLDVLGDTLRGTKEIMMDLFRRPDEVIEACERLTPIMVKGGVKGCDQAVDPFCYLPLHKGADGFMSEEQFKTFYWPSLRKTVIGLIDEGVIPILFAEGGYNSRLEVIDDLPRGKVIWYFDKTDMKRAKETVGRTNCLMGNVPMDLLYAGSVTEVNEYCRNLIEIAGKDGGFIFSTGAGMQGAKVENVKAMIECGKKHGVY